METLNTLTPAEAAVAGSIVGGVISTILVCALIFYVFLVIAGWKIFKKAGEPGWKILIPIYNIYIMFKIVKMQNWFWGLLALSICASILMAIDGTSELSTMTEEQLKNFNLGEHPLTIITMIVSLVIEIWAGVIYAIRTSRAFGHGKAFAVGIFLLPSIFWLIIGFDKSKYHKKAIEGKYSSTDKKE